MKQLRFDSMTPKPLYPEATPLYGTGKARTSDPDSSHHAARKMIDSGALGRHAAIVLAVVRRFPRLTSAELASRCELDRYQVARRLPELEAQDLVERPHLGGSVLMRTCRATGNLSATWLAKGGT